MSFSSENGYTPLGFTALMDFVRVGVNTQFGTTYTAETFVGTNWYKFAYAIIQKLQENEIKASEVFQKLQQYITQTNSAIQRPTVSHVGLLDAFEGEGYVASVKEPLEADAGKVHICVHIDEDIAGSPAKGEFEITDYAALVSGTDDSVTVGATAFTAQTGSVTPGGATFQAATSNSATATSLAAQINAHATAGALVLAEAFGAKVKIKALARGTAGNSIALDYTDNDTNVGATKSGTTLSGGAAAGLTWSVVKLEVCTLIKDFVAAGMVTQGEQEESIALSNGQSFDFKFDLPNLTPIVLRCTLVESENNLLAIPSDEDIREAIFENINERYRMGWNFEPQRYFGLSDALWAQSVLLEYSFDDEDTWSSAVYDSEFSRLLTFGLEDIEVVIT